MNDYPIVAIGNVFSYLPVQIDREILETIISFENLTIDRIVSRGSLGYTKNVGLLGATTLLKTKGL
jgi:hypothetical protein